jgi:hypothetical protein
VRGARIVQTDASVEQTRARDASAGDVVEGSNREEPGVAHVDWRPPGEVADPLRCVDGRWLAILDARAVRDYVSMLDESGTLYVHLVGVAGSC